MKKRSKHYIFLPFLPSKQCFCASCTLPRPKRQAQVRSKIITPEKRQFIHVFKELKQVLKVQDKDDILVFCVNKFGTVSRFYNIYFMSCKTKVSLANRNICNFYKI